jgi:DNA invertase Pin-like site-specific DNA recombinase
MEYGYIRTFGSSDRSHKELGEQFATLSKYGLNTQHIVVEQFFDSQYQTSNLEELLNNFNSDDVIVVSSFASISNGISDLLRLVRFCIDKGANFISINDSIDTRVCGEIFLSMLETSQEVERAKLRRINARRTPLERSGKRGRPKLDEFALENAARLYLSGKYTMKEVVAETGISQASIFRKVRAIKEAALTK